MTGINKICIICCNKITVDDVDDNNGPYTIEGIPGFCHKKCKIDYDNNIISTSRFAGDLSKWTL